MIIHKSPYPSIDVPHVTLPTFVFKPLQGDAGATASVDRLLQPLTIPAPYHEEFNPQPQRPSAEGLSLAGIKNRAEAFALGLRQQGDWSQSGRVFSIVSENQVSVLDLRVLILSAWP